MSRYFRTDRYLRPHQLDSVIDALEARSDSPGVTVAHVHGFGHPKGGGPAEFLERRKLEIVVPDDWVEDVVDIIVDEAHTGRYGDGKIFVSDVEEAVRIRTGERGEAAVRFVEGE
jgi:nitrogen regulatory protein P-II 1